MIAAAIYGRQSAEQCGVDDEAKSVALQIQNARTFAVEKSWTVAEEHVYFDDAVSGADIPKLTARQRPVELYARHDAGCGLQTADVP